MPRLLKVAVGEMPGILHDIPANFACAAELSRAAAAAGAKVIILPEACLTGYAMREAADQALLPLEAAAFKPLTAVAADTGITICAGFVTAFEDGVNCCHAIIEPSGPVRFQRKAGRASSEPAFYRKVHDPRREMLEIDGIRLAVIICCEWGSPAVMDAAKAAGAQLLLHPSAGSIPAAEVLFSDPGPEKLAEVSRGMRKVVDGAAAGIGKHGLPKVGANPIGFDGQTYWPGNSYAINADGSVPMWLEGTHLVAAMHPRIATAEVSVG